MKKLLLISLMAIFLSSCLTVGRIQRNCDEFAKVCLSTTTVYRDTTIYHKDTVRIQLPSDTVTIDRVLTVNGTLVSLEPVSVTKGFITAKAWVLNNRLTVDAWLNKTYVETVRTDTITITKIVKETANVVTLPAEKYIPKFFKYSGWFVILLLVGSALWVVNKFTSGGIITSAGNALTKIKGLF